MYLCSALVLVLATSTCRPVFARPLDEHLKLCQCEVAVVIEQCVTTLKALYMDTEVREFAVVYSVVCVV